MTEVETSKPVVDSVVLFKVRYRTIDKEDEFYEKEEGIWTEVRVYGGMDVGVGLTVSFILFFPI